MKNELTAKEFAGLIEEIAPLESAYEWDNSGYNVKCHDHIRSVLICLDLSKQVLDEAATEGCDTILTHHPVLFHGVKQLRNDLPVSNLAIQAIQQGYNVYCAHTSFDCAPKGMNHILAELFELREEKPLIIEKQSNGLPIAVLGSIGNLKEAVKPETFVKMVKEKLNCAEVRYVPVNKLIYKVAIIGGAGGDGLIPAVQAGADVLITGEVKHNVYCEAAETGLMLCETGHYDSEKVFCRHMYMCLQKRLCGLQYNITVKNSKYEARPYIVFEK